MACGRYQLLCCRCTAGERRGLVDANLSAACPPTRWLSCRVHFFFTYIFIAWVCWLIVQYYKASRRLHTR